MNTQRTNAKRHGLSINLLKGKGTNTANTHELRQAQQAINRGKCVPPLNGLSQSRGLGEGVYCDLIVNKPPEISYR